ncbi:MAG: dihydrodipicolinate synthase family protein [Vicinamibacterales bacterium]
MSPLAGLYTPIVTPFNHDTVDDAALHRNVERYMQTRLTGLVVLGSNGEAVMLDDSEAERVIAAARSAMPSTRPLIAGTGAESTKATIAATLRAARAGADAVLVRTPSFFKNMMTADVFVRHYVAVAEASPVPVLLYNVSMYTGVTLPPDAVGLLAEHPNIVGMKESGSDASLLADYISRSGPEFFVLAGSGVTYFTGLAAGAHGAILALAGLVPDLCADLLDHVRAGRFLEARALQRTLTPLARTIGGLHGVPALKAALDLMGYDGGLPRAPLGPTPPSVIGQLRRMLTDLGVPLVEPASMDADPATT